MDKDTKKRRIEDDKTILNQGIRDIEISQNLVKQDIEKFKTVSEDIDEMKHNAEKGLALDYLLESNIDTIDDKSWSGYEQFTDTNRKLFTIANIFSSDVQCHHDQTFALASSAATLNAASGSGLSGAFITFSSIPDPALQTEIKKIWTDTIDHELESIRTDLQSEYPQLLNDFNKVVRDWRSMQDSDKYKVLIEIRSIIVDRLLDNICPKEGPSSKLCKTSWCFQGIRLRIFQAKFFMIGYRDESKLLQSTLEIINKIAIDFQNHFDDLSEKGKNKTSGIGTDILFRNVISWLHQALINHKTYFKPTP
jgi:hypothetical protein